MDKAQLDPFGRAGVMSDIYPNDPSVTPGSTDTIRTEEKIIKAVMETYRHEYDTRKPHEAEWDRAWRRVQNRYDWSRKSKWQSQKNFPAVLILALQYVWEFTKALEKAGDKWFSAETNEMDWQPLLDVPRDLVRQFIQDTATPEDSFLNVYYEAMFWGVITGQVMLRCTAEEDGFTDMTDEAAAATISDVYAAAGISSAIPSFGFGSIGAEAPDTPPTPPGRGGFRVRIEALNPRYAVKDTVGRRRMRNFIHTQTMTRAEFRKEGKARGWKHIDEICAMDTQFQGEYNVDQRKTLEKNLAKNAPRMDQIVLHHCYGDFYDTRGELVTEKENQYFIIANKKFMTGEPMDMPYWHGQIPIVCGGTLMLPGNPYSKSLLGVNLDAQETKVDLNNQILDYMNASINPATEVDVDQLNNVRPNQLAGGIFPGKIFEVQKYGGNTGPAVARSGMPDMSGGVWQSFGYLKQELQDYTGMGGSSAMPRTQRTRTSAAEAKERIAASVGIIEQIAHNLERFVLEPAIHQVYLILLQKCPQEEWAAFIDKKISSLENRTHTMPPGSGPATPAAPAQPPPPSQNKDGMPARSEAAPGQPAQPPVPPTQSGLPPNAPQPNQPNAPEYEDPVLVQKLTAMKDMTPKERFVKFGGMFRFKVKIYTAIENRRDKLEKLLQIIEMAQGTPTMMSRIKWHNVTEEVFECLELDPERYLWPNAGATADQMTDPNAQQINRPPSLMAPPVTQAPIQAPHSFVGGGT